MVEMTVDLGEIFGDEVVREGIYCGNVGKLLGRGELRQISIYHFRSVQKRQRRSKYRDLDLLRYES